MDVLGFPPVVFKGDDFAPPGSALICTPLEAPKSVALILCLITEYSGQFY